MSGGVGVLKSGWYYYMQVQCLFYFGFCATATICMHYKRVRCACPSQGFCFLVSLRPTCARPVSTSAQPTCQHGRHQRFEILAFLCMKKLLRATGCYASRVFIAQAVVRDWLNFSGRRPPRPCTVSAGGFHRLGFAFRVLVPKISES